MVFAQSHMTNAKLVQFSSFRPISGNLSSVVVSSIHACDANAGRHLAGYAVECIGVTRAG